MCFPMMDANALTLHPAIIAIDGPAGSGKSTVGHRLAHRIGYLFFDSGIMYRAVTWAAQAQGIDPADAERVGALAETLDLDILPPGADAADGRTSTVLIDGQDVTWALRTPAVDHAVSAVSAHGRVRAALSHHQRRIGLRYGAGRGDKRGIVMVGRDIGSVILPEAPLKIYLDATPEERARRRHAELAARGRPLPFALVLEEIVQRDAYDSGRAVSPLRMAEGALLLDSTGMSPEEVVERIIALARVGAA